MITREQKMKILDLAAEMAEEAAYECEISHTGTYGQLKQAEEYVEASVNALDEYLEGITE